jgi:transcriptional regulator with XRE-family HTH domain
MEVPGFAMSDSALGGRLVSVRKRCGLTQRDLARRAGVSMSLIRQIEQGERDTTQLQTARKLAVALSVPTSLVCCATPGP